MKTDPAQERDTEGLMRELKISRRTVTRYVKTGCPVLRREGRKLFFYLPDVHAWRNEQGIDGTPGRPSNARAMEAAQKAIPGGVTQPGRATLAKATLAGKALSARKRELDLKREQGLEGLGLGDKIRAARTLEDLVQLSLEVTALDAEGKVTPTRSRSLKGQLTEARQILTAHAAQPKEAVDVTLLYREETLLVAEAFDKLVSDERRAQVRELVYTLLERDLAELPSVDPQGRL